ncbi:hypothetical protein [Papillibacter cinnamivorans]|uniref:Uncharacterized protein n=1 Tax=Papillibacter cinnamivorans DSM 12816 TaxID=1122930 RepID=A0A1W2CTH8_9FIRM|nr:hypothetical protein [Papillibacter cinnamivorans]SMC88234.1 hypothetical protein SAMN02745168_0216 [Papillibacter cinnamivorans DSM 12816]
MVTNYLDMFKNLQISKKELSNKLGGNLHVVKLEKPVTIFNTDVINVLRAIRDGRITLNQLLDWVNTVWFTDLYEYDDEYSDSIASVLDKLEDLDEEYRKLTKSDIEKYINALSENKEV